MLSADLLPSYGLAYFRVVKSLHADLVGKPNRGRFPW